MRISFSNKVYCTLVHSFQWSLDQIYDFQSFNQPMDFQSIARLVGFQIYFDFAGYSHIAIGCAKLMGINFPENFNFPYASKSFKSFWKRWHISLSSWIRDYLYLPLSGVKVIDTKLKSKGGIDTSKGISGPSQQKRDKALFLTWTIMGLWHGANWTFVFWGIYHASMVYLERLLKPFRAKNQFFSKSLVGWGITLLLSMLGWIPFRAQSMMDVKSMFLNIVNPLKYTFYSMRENTYLVAFLLLILVTVTFLLTEYEQNQQNQFFLWRIPFNILKFTVIIILVFTFFRPISQFIYFQF